MFSLLLACQILVVSRNKPLNPSREFKGIILSNANFIKAHVQFSGKLVKEIIEHWRLMYDIGARAISHFGRHVNRRTGNAFSGRAGPYFAPIRMMKLPENDKYTVKLPKYQAKFARIWQSLKLKRGQLPPCLVLLWTSSRLKTSNIMGLWKTANILEKVILGDFDEVLAGKHP